MIKNLEQTIKKCFSFSPNRNQLQDIERLVFEILKREDISLQQIIGYLTETANTEKFSGRNKFFAIKDALLKRRFPLTYQNEKIDTRKIFLPKVKSPLPTKWQVKKTFTPLKIFVEKKVKDSPLVNNFRNKFPQVEVEELTSYKDYIKKNKFNIVDFKKPYVFIVQEKWDFIKPCPCSKGHLSCGYWIFNLGFGCPFDCSYCSFLQQYTNSPGIILPANLEDFFDRFDSFSKNLVRPIRIGTGEFCDSLALDSITQYSRQLIPYFSAKNVLFELKTKSSNITNLLMMKPSPNIIISWSLNPEHIVKTEELATASLSERLEAAKLLQEKGYKLGFHFDPIIYSKNWCMLYKEIIDRLYHCLKPPFAWISLGTLRSNRNLKTIAELRFPKSTIFYEELFLGDDKKIRYPRFLRKDIYKNMLAWIRNYDNKTPLYLCMEDRSLWAEFDTNLNSTVKIEKCLLNI
jgi:spore photoproduct lyase